MAAPTPDVMAIANLLKRERFYRDTGQWDLCRAAFHPDGAATHIDVSWYKGPIDPFLHQSSQIHNGKINIIHSSFDPVDIHVRGTRAISQAFCLVTSSMPLNGVDYELASHMRLFNRLEKVSDLNNEWRILSLEASYVRDRLVTTFPSSGSNNNGEGASSLLMTDEARAYPKGYRHLAVAMLAIDLKPRTDLPHEDDPESWKGIVERNWAFLEGS